MSRLLCALLGHKHPSRPVWCPNEKRVRYLCTRCYAENFTMERALNG